MKKEFILDPDEIIIERFRGGLGLCYLTPTDGTFIITNKRIYHTTIGLGFKTNIYFKDVDYIVPKGIIFKYRLRIYEKNSQSFYTLLIWKREQRLELFNKQVLEQQIIEPTFYSEPDQPHDKATLKTRVKTKIKSICSSIPYLIGALFIMFSTGYVYANIPIRQALDLFYPKVSVSDVTEGYYRDFVGRISAGDIPVYSAETLELERSNLDILPVFVVETDTLIPLGGYELKDSDSATVSRRGFNGRIIGEIERNRPLFYTDYLFAAHYLAQIEDGTYITVFMDQDYAKMNFGEQTLPIGQVERATQNLEEYLVSYAEYYDDDGIEIDDINTEYMLTMFIEENGTPITEGIVRMICGALYFIILLWFMIIIEKWLTKISGKLFKRK